MRNEQNYFHSRSFIIMAKVCPLMYILRIIQVKQLRKLRYQLDNLQTFAYFQLHNTSVP